MFLSGRTAARGPERSVSVCARDRFQHEHFDSQVGVDGFMSDNHIDPDLAVEVFVLEPLPSADAH